MLCVGNFHFSIDSYNIFLHTYCFGYPELIFPLKTCLPSSPIHFQHEENKKLQKSETCIFEDVSALTKINV